MIINGIKRLSIRRNAMDDAMDSAMNDRLSCKDIRSVIMGYDIPGYPKKECVAEEVMADDGKKDYLKSRDSKAPNAKDMLEAISHIPDCYIHDCKAGSGPYDEEQLMIQCNKNGNVPGRFKQARLGDSPLAKEMRDFAINGHNPSSSDKSDVIVLAGSPGVGKTYLMCASMHERSINRCGGGAYLSCKDLPIMLNTAKSFKAENSEDDIYRRYSTVPYLCIDELGGSFKRKEEMEFISTLIAKRYDNEVKTVIATNMSCKQFYEYFSHGKANKNGDVIDRLLSLTKVINVSGKSLRRRYGNNK